MLSTWGKDSRWPGVPRPADGVSSHATRARRPVGPFRASVGPHRECGQAPAAFFDHGRRDRRILPAFNSSKNAARRAGAGG
eukprot:3900454-Prymnesium_polylepis.1